MMKSRILALMGVLLTLGAAMCSAAIVPLPNGAIRVALIDGSWPAAGSDWVRSNESLIDLFYASATQADAQFSVGTRVQVYNVANQQFSKGIVVPRPDISEDRGQWGIFSKTPPSSFEYERRIGWSALPLSVVGPGTQDPTVPYVGPLVESVVVPEPGSLLIWLVITGYSLCSAIAYRCRPGRR